MPKVTIITASYNYEKYIGETIESVMAQTFTDWEMLVIDDGSKDNSIEVISEYARKDNRIKLITHPNNENKGLVSTLQTGIAKAEGEYIAFVESDDRIKSDYLEKKLKYFEKYPDTGFIYNDIETFGAECSIKRRMYFELIKGYWKKHNYPHNIGEILYIRNYIPTFSCVMLKKELFDDLNWDSPYMACIDWWLWVQISQKTEFYFIPECLTLWRLHKDSYLNRSRKNCEDKVMKFHSNLYNFLPPIKHLRNKFRFIIKQFMIFSKNKNVEIGNFKHLLKKG